MSIRNLTFIKITLYWYKMEIEIKQIETKKRKREESDRILTPDEYKELVKQRNKRIQEENRDFFKDYARLVRYDIVAKLSSGEKVNFINVTFQKSNRVPEDFLISEEYHELKEEFKLIGWKLCNLTYAWYLTVI